MLEVRIQEFARVNCCPQLTAQRYTVTATNVNLLLLSLIQFMIISNFLFSKNIRASTMQIQVKRLRFNNFPNPSSLKEGKVARWYQEIPRTKCVKDVNENTRGRFIRTADDMALRG